MSDKDNKQQEKINKTKTTNNRLAVEYYKHPRIRSTWFLLGLVIGYMPYVIHESRVLS